MYFFFKQNKLGEQNILTEVRTYVHETIDGLQSQHIIRTLQVRWAYGHLCTIIFSLKFTHSDMSITSSRKYDKSV